MSTEHPRVLILGAGFGGLSAAHTLRQEVGEMVDLVLVDIAPSFSMGLRKLWFLDGRTGRGEGVRDRSNLSGRGIPFRQAAVEAIDLDRRWVQVDGDAMGFDFLVVALGAMPRADLVPGDAAANPNLYTVDGAEEAGRRLADLEQGRILIVIAGVPYKCPPAPYEAAFIMDDVFRRTGRRDRIEIEVITPQPMSIPAAGPAACTHVEGHLKAKGIRFRPKTTIEGVDRDRVTLAGGDTLEGDLVILVPPHRPPAPVKESGLCGDGEWVPVDTATLASAHENVFAIGDVVDMATGAGLPFPKAGVFAERHGEVVGRNIAAMVAGRDPEESFDGYGYCFLESGGGMASMVKGNFLAAPPDVAITEASPEHLEAKVAFERERLERWFRPD